MKTTPESLAPLLLFCSLMPVLAQDNAAAARTQSVELWLVEKPILGKGAYKSPNRPIWRLADLKKMCMAARATGPSRKSASLWAGASR